MEKKIPVPEFLRFYVGYSNTQMEESMSNWASMLYHLNNAKSEEEILQMIAIELETKNRWPHLDRMKTRLNTLRKQREHQELEEFSKWMKSQSNVA